MQSISIVIPAFNEQKYIAQCLRSIEKHRHIIATSLEVTVVNNGSTDDTSKIAKQFAVNVLDIERHSVSYARNFGVANSQGSVIAFVDGDVELTEQWFVALNQLACNLSDEQPIVTGFQCRVPPDGSWIEKHWFANLTDQYLGGANIITTRHTFSLLQGFDEQLKTGEDYDFCLRAIKQELNYQVNSEFNAIHLGFPHRLQDFIRREMWHGEGDFRSFEKFRQSIVAILACYYLIATLAALICLVIQLYVFASLFALSVLGLNGLITLKRFGLRSLSNFVINYFLNGVYFFARVGSLWKALKKRHLKY
ncbi:MAG: glycosyltransferase [Gammaproteobacteria bacterium]|nr:glycosyltransferase [Gammaproteobacteria bacterium]NVK86656.1 glycosyltransferase [Gammaproteobacteria bacterium]